MKMLLTQLQYQDPTAPMDQTAMVQQLSSLTMMEQNAELVAAMNSLRDQVYQSQGLYASNLVGKEVMVIANLFKVEDGRHPNGEVLLNFAASDLRIEVYEEGKQPDTDDPVATMELGEQLESGGVDYDLANLKKPLKDGTYMMYAYAKVDGQDLEQPIVQRSVVLSVVIPGGGQDVLVDVKGIGLVPLYAITEFQGDYIPGDGPGGGGDDEKPVQPLPPHKDPLAMAAQAGLMKTYKRDGEVWTKNPFFNQSDVSKTATRKPPTIRETMFRTVR